MRLRTSGGSTRRCGPGGWRISCTRRARRYTPKEGSFPNGQALMDKAAALLPSVMSLVGVVIGAVLLMVNNWWVERRRRAREDASYWRNERRSAYSEALMAADAYRESALRCVVAVEDGESEEKLSALRDSAKRACARWQDVVPVLELIGSEAANRAASDVTNVVAVSMCVALGDLATLGINPEVGRPPNRSNLALETHQAIARFLNVIHADLGVPQHDDALRPPVATPHFDVDN